MKSLCPYSQCSHLNLLSIFPLRVDAININNIFLIPVILKVDVMQKLESLKKNMNVPRPFENSPVRGEKCQNVCVGSIAANTRLENTKPLHGI